MTTQHPQISRSLYPNLLSPNRLRDNTVPNIHNQEVQGKQSIHQSPQMPAVDSKQSLLQTSGRKDKVVDDQPRQHDSNCGYGIIGRNQRL
jgi:hypothetical protein